jgi:hypothetical protein
MYQCIYDYGNKCPIGRHKYQLTNTMVIKSIQIYLSYEITPQELDGVSIMEFTERLLERLGTLIHMKPEVKKQEPVASSASSAPSALHNNNLYSGGRRYPLTGFGNQNQLRDIRKKGKKTKKDTKTFLQI